MSFNSFFRHLAKQSSFCTAFSEEKEAILDTTIAEDAFMAALLSEVDSVADQAASVEADLAEAVPAEVGNT